MLETKPSNIQVATLKGQWTEESAWKAVRSGCNSQPHEERLSTSSAHKTTRWRWRTPSLPADTGRRTRKMVQLTFHWLQWTTHHESIMGSKGIARRNDLHSTNCRPGSGVSHRSNSEWNKATGILGDGVVLNPPSGCTGCAEVITCCVAFLMVAGIERDFWTVGNLVKASA